MYDEDPWLDEHYLVHREWEPWRTEAELISAFLEAQPTPPLTGIEIAPGFYQNKKRKQDCFFVKQDGDYVWIDVHGAGQQCWDVLHFRSEWTASQKACHTDN